MSDEPIVNVHGESVPQSMLLMVESAAINGAKFSHDGGLLVAPLNANRDALELFERSLLTVALALEWLRARGGARSHVSAALTS